MHPFDELVDYCAGATLRALGEADERTIEALQTSGATPLVTALQMSQLQRAIFAVGMFSMFEATLKDKLNCSHGFNEATVILDQEGSGDLKERFGDLILAINVLKHGRGRSYNALVAKADKLPFRVKLPDEAFFSEGDVSEVSTLIEVDDAFVRSCSGAIREVSETIRAVRPGFY